eukprot:34728-Eustigmatos_ZCMA.PRE.1
MEADAVDREVRIRHQCHCQEHHCQERQQQKQEQQKQEQDTTIVIRCVSGASLEGISCTKSVKDMSRR